MRKLLYSILTFLVLGVLVSISTTSCSDTETYADLVSSEKTSINTFISEMGFSYTKVDEDWINDVTDAVLKDSLDPADYLELNKWYSITEGDFKRLYFKIKNWGYEYPNPASGKIYTGKNVLVRYDSCYNLGDWYGLDTLKGDNLDPNSYEIVYNWNSSYYASSYYGSYYGTGTSYECTSAGLAFPCRFLWYGAEVSLIIPFSLANSSDQSYYLTCYYGSVKYTKPTYLPE